MDTNLNKEIEDDRTMNISQMSPMDITCNESLQNSTPQNEYEETRDALPIFNPINIFEGKRNLKLLVDFFYLPFNSGPNGVKFLKDFQWLHEHANIMKKTTSLLENDQLDIVQWSSKAEWIISIADAITELYLNLLDAPNRNLAQEIFPFVWEIQSILTILKAIINWMQVGVLQNIPEEQGDWWDTSHLQEEPWSLGGGLLVDLQKLIVKNQEVAEFFSLKLAAIPSAACYSLDAVNIEDINKQELFEFFTSQNEKNIFVNDKAYNDQYVTKC